MSSLRHFVIIPRTVGLDRIGLESAKVIASSLERVGNLETGMKQVGAGVVDGATRIANTLDVTNKPSAGLGNLEGGMNNAGLYIGGGIGGGLVVGLVASALISRRPIRRGFR